MKKLALASAVASCLVLATMGIASAVSWAIDHKFGQLRLEAASRSTDFVTMADRTRQLECLARNIYYEAGRESFEGKVAVAQVTVNRTRSNQFPHDICAVVYQRNLAYDKIICQFSWYCEGNHRTRVIDPDAYQESYRVAKKVLLEGFRLDSLAQAMYYHADYVNPRWKLVPIAKIGKHIFYKG